MALWDSPVEVGVQPRQFLKNLFYSLAVLEESELDVPVESSALVSGFVSGFLLVFLPAPDGDLWSVE